MTVHPAPHNGEIQDEAARHEQEDREHYPAQTLEYPLGQASALTSAAACSRIDILMIANMLWLMLGRSLASAVYLGATLFWLAAMALSAALGCEGGCGESEVHRLDVSEVLAVIGLAIAAAAFLCSLFSRWLGLSLLALHAVVFAVNLGVFWNLADTPWVLIPPASLAAAVGYVAVGGVRRGSSGHGA
jgi:hypothetical protein